MTDRASTQQAHIYETGADAYDALVSAEDCDGNLVRELERTFSFDGSTWLDLGAGTGRITRLLGARSQHVHLVDRAPAMLAVAEARLTALGRTNFSIHIADATTVPLEASSMDASVAGWVFGHFRHWMPDGWRDEVDRALSEMERVTRGPRVVIETLGTGHETPRKHAALDEYFAHLETRGFVRSWVRTDYLFVDVASAVATCEAFFGAELAARVREKGEPRVPECTAIFVAR